MILEENQLLPYTLSQVPPGPWLVFAPHPDDETFGMGGSLLLAKQLGIQTHVVFVTDGALGGEGDREALVVKRMEEARAATSVLEVDSIHFFGEPDRGLKLSEGLRQRTVALLERLRPASVFFPSPMEYHPDHRVTAELAWQSAGCISGFPISCYGYEISTLAPINTLLDVSEFAGKKYQVVKMYASQLTQAKYLALVQALDTARTFSLPMDRIAAEGFFHFSDRSATLQQQIARCLSPFFAGVSEGVSGSAGERDREGEDEG
jgi:LmbE family N-acetylglucosaminyl deacetylase